MELETIKFIKNNINWKELLVEKPYHLTIKEDEYYYLLKYNQLESDFSNPIVKECRGLIIDKQTLEPVALSFKKFWEVEVEELADDIDWNSARVQTKCDGSKILVFYNEYKQEWQYTTSGNINAYEAKIGDFDLTFGELFEKALANNNYTKEGFELNLIKNYCYTFELVAPENRVVVKYDKPDLYFIGVRDCDIFEEIKPIDYNNRFGFLIKTPKEYPLNTLEDCIKATEQMTYNEEGYVVVDKNWHRIKIKSPAWKMASHLKGEDTLSKRRILEIIEADTQEEMLKIFPEYKEYFDDMENKIISFKAYLDNASYDTSKKFEYGATRKEIAIYVMNNYKDISSFLFSLLVKEKEDKWVIGFDEDTLFEWWSELTLNKKLEYLKNI